MCEAALGEDRAHRRRGSRDVGGAESRALAPSVGTRERASSCAVWPQPGNSSGHTVRSPQSVEDPWGHVQSISGRARQQHA